MNSICLAVHHVRFEDLGSFAQVLERHGYRIVSRHASRVREDEWRDADLVVVLGGPIGAGDSARYPWLDAELEGIAQRLRRQAPTLGICLGAQLMAAAIGASVQPRGAGSEIGWAPLALGEPAGPLQALQDIAVLHWHGDNIELPDGMAALAATPHTPCQAFQLGDYGLGLQFHAEFDDAALEEWLTGHALELQRAGIDLQRLRADTRRHGGALKTAGRQVLNDWLSTLKGST